MSILRWTASRRFLATSLLWILVSGCGQKKDESKTSGPLFAKDIRTTSARTPEEEQAGFIVPPGFEIQLFAAEPDIDKPINLSFDAKGRMWVTQSFEYPFPAAPGAKGADRVTILEDTDGDGRADRFTNFCDTLNIPIGIIPLTGRTIGFSVPNVYEFTDTNQDDKFERTKIMLGPFGYQDTHGMVSNFIRGYDGWVHACHGFTNRSSVAGSDGDSIHLVSGNTIRFRVDGSRVEQSTFGQVNPFGLAYDGYGYIYSTDSHSSPLYQLIRGGDYPHFGKVAVMGFAPDMKSLTTEATALCGIACYADTQYPEGFQGNFFIGDAVNSRVHRYSATWKGSSPVGKTEDDFIKSEDPWFRPVNVKLGPDGALYVADFYNPIIGHYEVPLNHPLRDKRRGRIWRISYKGKKNDVADLTKMNTAQLIAALDADNITTRMAATDQLTDRVGPTAVVALQEKLNDSAVTPRQIIHSLWALFRLNSLTEETLRSSMASRNALVRLHALRILAEKKSDESFLPLITASLKDTDPHVQRAAAELLMNYPSFNSVKAELDILRSVDPNVDTHLFYTARLGLRNILRHDEVLKQVTAGEWSDGDAGSMAGVMVDVPSMTAAQFLLNYMNRHTLPKERIAPAYQQIARFIPRNQLPTIIDKALSENNYEITLRSMVFKSLMEGLAQRGGKVDLSLFEKHAPAMADALLKKFPAGDLSDSDEKVLNQRVAIDIAGDYKVRALEPALRSFLDQGSKIGMGIRAAALRSLLKVDLPKNIELGAYILQHDSVLEYQRRIAAVLSEFPGDAVNQSLGVLNPIAPDLQGPVVVALAGSPAGKDILFKKIKRGDLLPRTLLDPRVEERVLMNATPAQQKEFAALTADVEPISKERQALIEKRLLAFEQLNRPSFSLDSGRTVFDQNCGTCHKTKGQMGIAPQLDGVGKRGARAIMEKVLDPNRNVSQAFQNFTVRLKDGTIKSGLFRRDEGDVKVFADLSGKEFFVARKDIAELKASPYTLMPDSFGTTVTEREFYQLINYVLSL